MNFSKSNYCLYCKCPKILWLNKYKPEENNMFFATTKGKTKYTDIDYSKMDEVFVLYGKETKGLPEWLLEK